MLPPLHPDADRSSPGTAHKSYFRGAHRITMRVSGDAPTGWLLGMHLVGHNDAAAAVAKRVNIAAAALFTG